MATVESFAPGRVNLIGDHTDYNGGFVLPMAVQLGTTVTLSPGGSRLLLTSSASPDACDISLEFEPTAVPWVRLTAGVVAEVHPGLGGCGRVESTLPLGAGLSSSASLEVAVALALDPRLADRPLDLALLCQRAEQQAWGVPCGIMDQLTAAAGVAGHALLIDCMANSWDPVPLPDACAVVAVHSGIARSLEETPYAQRRRECEAAAALAGPLRNAKAGSLRDPLLRRRARHVVTENERVLAFTDALRAGDLAAAGSLMLESHSSLSRDFEVSTPELDDLVGLLRRTPGVFGARLTGAGFGGCVVALCDAGAASRVVESFERAWALVPSAGARVVVTTPRT